MCSNIFLDQILKKLKIHRKNLNCSDNVLLLWCWDELRGATIFVLELKCCLLWQITTELVGHHPWWCRQTCPTWKYHCDFEKLLLWAEHYFIDLITLNGSWIVEKITYHLCNDIFRSMFQGIWTDKSDLLLEKQPLLPDRNQHPPWVVTTVLSVIPADIFTLTNHSHSSIVLTDWQQHTLCIAINIL